jgi:hypothetical protein
MTSDLGSRFGSLGFSEDLDPAGRWVTLQILQATFFPGWVDILQGPDDFKGASLAARVVSIMNREVWFLWLSSRFQILKSSLS